MELGSWSLITAPSLLALIPLIVMIVLVFRGKSNVSGMMVGIILGALMMGQDLGALAKAFSASLGSTTALIGVIIMTGAGLTHTLVYWIVKRIGVNTPTKGKLALVVCSILICGLLGTLGGGNAVIAPIMLPILASLGVTPTVVATLFKVAGEIGLMVGPLTGVTLITMEVTGLSYGQLMLQAVLPFSCFWLVGAWIGCNRAQKRTLGKESYSVDDDIKHLDRDHTQAEENNGRVPGGLRAAGGVRDPDKAGHLLRLDRDDRIGGCGDAILLDGHRYSGFLCDQGCGLSGEYVPDLHYH